MTGSVDDLGKMMAESGAQPVTGEVEEGLNGAMEDASLPLDETIEQARQDAAADEGAEPEVVEEADDQPTESPYILFGERIIVTEIDGTTFVTKPYTLPVGRPKKIVTLLDALNPFPHVPPPADASVPIDPNGIEYQILDGLDDEFYTNLQAIDTLGTAPTSTTLSDVMVVTATPRMLLRFEEFLDLFAGGGVPQIELEAKIIEISELDTIDIGGGGTVLFGGSNFVQQLAVGLPNFASGSEAVLSLGAIQDDTTFEGILEAIKSWQNVSIESKPRTVVRAGGVARIEAMAEIPFLQFKTLDANGFFTGSTNYKKIGVGLWISPRMVGSNTLSLDVRIEASQRVGSQAIISAGGGGSGGSIPVEVPVIAYRTAKTVVHLQPGQTLVIGGMTQEREQEIVSRVPILGDLPLIGWLFQSTFDAVETQHVLFAISPRIVQHSDLEPDF